MSRRHRSTAFLTLVACAALGLVAPWSAHALPLPHQRDGQLAEEESALGRAMEQMKGATRRLERVLQTDDVALALELLAGFQAGVVAAKSEVPPKAEGLSGSERDEFVIEYRATLVELLRVTCDLEEALLQGRLDGARSLYEGQLKAMQKPSHDRFRDEDE